MISTQLQNNAIPVVSIAAGDDPYSAGIGDEVINVDTDGGDVTVNLPAGIDSNHKKIVNTGTSGNTAVVVPDGTEQIRGGGAGVQCDVEDGETLDVNFDPATDDWLGYLE